MFRGREQAKIDEKGRLKVPAKMRQKLMEGFGADVFMTIVSDSKLTIFPLPVWEEKERQFLKVPDSLPEKESYLFTANFMGSEKTMDDQGRLPIPTHLREELGLDGDVEVVGLIDKILVMRPDTARQWVRDHFPTPQVSDRLKEYGI